MMWTLWIAAAMAGGADLPSVETTKVVLENGLTVVVYEEHRTDQVALQVRYGVGGRDEQPGEYGCAHLFEHLMFEGSANVPPNAFDTWLTQAGGWNNAFTNSDETTYYEVFPSGALNLGLFLESDRMGMLLPGVTQENLSNQQSVVLQERAEGFEKPHGRDGDALMTVVFPEGHPYHVSVIGTIADVEGFSVEAVHDFWTRWYRPQNAILVIAGNVETDEVLAEVRHWFSDVPDPGPAPERLAADVELPRLASHGLLEDTVEDRTVYMVWPTVPLGHADEPALDILAWILSGGPGTRLDDRLYYNSKLATDTDSAAWNMDLDGLFFLQATSPKTSLAKLSRISLDTVAGISANPPTDEELERAKITIKGFILDSMESPRGMARLLSDCTFQTGDPNCTVSEWRRYEAVTASDVVRVAEAYLMPEKMSTLSVVPNGEADTAMEGAEPVVLP